MSERAEHTPKDEIFATTVGIKEYALEKGEDSEALIKGAVLSASSKMESKFKDHPDMTKEEFLEKHGIRIVSEVTAEHMQSGLSIPRVFFGGKHELADVLEATSCIDAAVFTREVLKEGFGVASEVKTARLLTTSKHHYLELDNGSVIDPIIGSKKNLGGFFKNKKMFDRTLSTINSGGVTAVVKQIKNIINPQDEGEPDFRQNKSPAPTSNAMQI